MSFDEPIIYELTLTTDDKELLKKIHEHRNIFLSTVYPIIQLGSKTTLNISYGEETNFIDDKKKIYELIHDLILPQRKETPNLKENLEEFKIPEKDITRVLNSKYSHVFIVPEKHNTNKVKKLISKCEENKNFDIIYSPVKDCVYISEYSIKAHGEETLNILKSYMPTLSKQHKNKSKYDQSVEENVLTKDSIAKEDLINNHNKVKNNLKVPNKKKCDMNTFNGRAMSLLNELN